MTAEIMQKLKIVFASHPEVVLAYLFGSQARGDAGPLSDYDFAIYMNCDNASDRFSLKLRLMGEIASVIGTDTVDVVVLNDTDAPELKYAVVQEGLIVYEKVPYRILVEPRILNEYFDFNRLLVQHNLTKDKAV